MQPPSLFTRSDLVIFLYPALFALFLWYKYYYVRRFGSIFRRDRPVSPGTYRSFLNALHILAAGKLDEHTYVLQADSSGRVLMQVRLANPTDIHLVALGAKSGLDTVLAHGAPFKYLEPVRLEGNFPKDFRMWCSVGHQIETRQLFGPETMAYFADFCRAYNFELYKGKVYISVAQDASDPADTTTMVDDVTHFIRHNKTVLDHLAVK